MIIYGTAFLGVLIFVLILTPISNYVGLIDKPASRKIHTESTPLIGGIALFSTTTLAAFFFVPPTKETTYLLAACGLLTMVGSLDDRFDLNFILRLIVQIIAAALLIWGSEIKLTSFGNLLGFGSIHLGVLEVPITIIAVVGMINAFNMIDGLDGLAGALGLICVSALYYLLKGQISEGPQNILILLLGGLSAYLIVNLHIFPQLTPKIFMGDAGSTLLGFTLTVFLIRYTQESKQVFSPVTALWLVSLPLMDSMVTWARRYRHSKNIFHADKSYIHHILLRARLSPTWILIIISIFQLISATIGILLESKINNQLISFFGILILFALYIQFITKAFKFSKWIRKILHAHSLPNHTDSTHRSKDIGQ